ncbi:MAG: hypothetical protein GXP45_03950 [bacterium]|nr:hypothetical protein [bacterium]
MDLEGNMLRDPIGFNNPSMINLQGNYRIVSKMFDPIVAPDDVLLLHQLLGDEFALPHVIKKQ